MYIVKKIRLPFASLDANIFFATAVIITLALVAIAYSAVFLPPRNAPMEHVFEVRSGMTVREIGSRLAADNVIYSRGLFTGLIRLMGQERDVKAGFYYFEKPLSLIDVVYRLTEGNTEITPIEVTIPEGATIHDAGILLAEKKLFSAESFWQAAGLSLLHYGNPLQQCSLILTDIGNSSSLLAEKPEQAGFEGYLFPDTYFFPPGIAPDAVIRVMIQNLDKKITKQMRTDIRTQGKTIHDILTMASIIEKEALSGEDGRIISGILWKRIENNFPLQADAVLAYVTGRGSFQLTVDDLSADSPYNVYERTGLPPTPIANAGIEAIRAAIYPKSSSYWYYLHGRDGMPHYAETFEEHKINKVRYLR